MTESNSLWLLAAEGLLLLWLLRWAVLRFIRVCKAANNVDWGNAGNNVIVGFIVLFCRYVHRFQFEPIPLPESGAALVAANHISGLDYRD